MLPLLGEVEATPPVVGRGKKTRKRTEIPASDYFRKTDPLTYLAFHSNGGVNRVKG